LSFTEGELESLETEGNKNIELKEFILSKVDPVFYETVHYLRTISGTFRPLRANTSKLAQTPA